jgi:ABC-type transport system involved in multi-copper enzyme maturation permease subunit
MTALVRSELRKLRTTQVWWIFGLTVLILTLLAVAVGMAEANFRLTEPGGAGPGGAPLSRADLYDEVVAGIYTSGQFFGLMFSLLLGTLLMTNEHQHQTASSTFLATPDRTRVVFAKLITAVLIGVLFWGITTVVDLIAGGIFLSTTDAGVRLTEPAVLQAIGLNLLAYVLWAILGIGLGTVIRSQIAAVILAIALYVLTGVVAQGILAALAYFLDMRWLMQLGVLLPATASDLMVTGSTQLEDMPPRWVGAFVLVCYGVLAGIAGTVITRRRDIA